MVQDAYCTWYNCRSIYGIEYSPAATRLQHLQVTAVSVGFKPGLEWSGNVDRRPRNTDSNTFGVMV